MSVTMRSITSADEQVWRKHWRSYNEFYERTESITEEITRTSFARILDKDNPIQCALAVAANDNVIGFVTWFPHPSTYLIEGTIYLQDLFVDPGSRNQGTGRKLIEHVYTEADRTGVKEVYWHTQYFNHRAQLLYTKVGKRADFIMYTRP